MREFTKLGFNLFTVFPSNSCNSLGEPYSAYKPLWLWYETYDFGAFDEQIEDVLAINPNAEFLCMVDLNSPLWLMRQLASSPGSDSYATLTDAITNPHWLELTRKYVAAFVDYAELKYGSRIKAYIPACGVTDEWMDYSNGNETAQKLSAYRQWAVKNALPEPHCIPCQANRFDAPHAENRLRDPQQNADALQYWKFHGELVADSIIEFAALIKSHLLTAKDVGVFYGYINELAHKRLVQCGHLAYEKVLASPMVDFFISPGVYYNREMGGFGGFMSPNGTVHRYGKKYMHECDQRTHTANMQLTPHVALSGMKRWENTRADIAGIRREFARSLLHGTSLWMFDMWGKFYVEPETLAAIGRCREIWEQYDDANTEPLSEVAVIVDPESILYVNDNNVNDPFPNLVHNHLITAANRLGAPYTVYSIKDIPEIKDFDRYKLVIFPALFEITPEKEALLQKYVFTSNRHVAWVFGAGFSDGQTWDENRMQRITGNASRWTSHTIAAYEDVSPQLLKTLAVQAGVHLYTEEAIPVFATENLLMVHTGESRNLVIRLRGKVKQAVELFEGRAKYEDAEVLEYQADGPETLLFELAT